MIPPSPGLSEGMTATAVTASPFQSFAEPLTGDDSTMIQWDRDGGPGVA